VNPHDDFPGFGCFDRKKRPLAPLLGRWNAEIDTTINKECAKSAPPAIRRGST
jgi:hypothetical protein